MSQSQCISPGTILQIALLYCALEGASARVAIVSPQDNVTPLMCAAASGSKEIAVALLEKEAEVDAVRVIMPLINNTFL